MCSTSRSREWKDQECISEAFKLESDSESGNKSYPIVIEPRCRLGLLKKRPNPLSIVPLCAKAPLAVLELSRSLRGVRIGDFGEGLISNY